MLGEGRMRCQDSALLQCSDRDPSLCSLPAGASGEATAGPGQEADLALSASGASCSAAAWPQTLWGCTSRARGAPGGSSVPCSICFLFSQHQKKPKKNPWDPQPPHIPLKCSGALPYGIRTNSQQGTARGAQDKTRRFLVKEPSSRHKPSSQTGARRLSSLFSPPKIPFSVPSASRIPGCASPAVTQLMLEAPPGAPEIGVTGTHRSCVPCPFTVPS